MGEAGVGAATDVTGFGLLGHLHIALEAAGAAAEIDAAAVPFLAGALDLARDGLAPSGTRRNLEFARRARRLGRTRRSGSGWRWPTRRPPAGC